MMYIIRTYGIYVRTGTQYVVEGENLETRVLTSMANAHTRGNIPLTDVDNH